MAEHPQLPAEYSDIAPQVPDDAEAGLAQAEAFLKDVAPHLGRLFGMNLNIQLGNGWSTALEGDSNLVTADPRFFIEKGYTPDMSSYATLHEVAAHLREKVTDPELTEKVLAFAKIGPAAAIFHNIFSDIAGNNLIHATLPRMKHIAERLYSEKLFAASDYTSLPRHLQFLYKVIREEMIPDSATAVVPEVDMTIAKLRNFQGQGDLIKYSTAVAKSNTEAMPGAERFAIWTGIIFPEYEKLLQQDREDNEQRRQEQQEQGDQEQGQQQGQDDQIQDKQGQGGQSQGEEADQAVDASQNAPQPTDAERFKDYYDDYKENHHPEPLDHSDDEHAHQKAHDQQEESDASEDTRPEYYTDQEKYLDQKVREETGHTLAEQRSYRAAIIQWQPEIQRLREAFQSVLTERTTHKRGLSRRAYAEGSLLDPDRLVQTVIDIQNNIPHPPAYKEYETKNVEAQAVGKTDYVFLFDCSGSMRYDQKKQHAASSVVICLEALSAMQRDLERTEAQQNAELDLDIRTAMYTFGNEATCVKPLSTKVSDKERMDAYGAALRPRGDKTCDFLALEAIETLPAAPDRRRIIVVVSDGQSSDSGRAASAISRLRASGWFVYGVALGKDGDESLYKPTSSRVEEPRQLPEALARFIKATMS